MIKFTLAGKDRTLVGLGLSAENMKRMIEGNPVFFKGEELGFEGVDFIIMTGETEEAIKGELKKYFKIDKEVDW